MEPHYSCGIDDTGPRLFETDPSGALLMVKATGIGSGRNIVMEFLEEKYNADIDIGNAIRLSLQALDKATEGKLTVDTAEIAAIDAKDNRFKKRGADELEEYVKSVLDSMPKE